MKHSEVLSRYVNTGQHIPEKQYDRLTPSLKKSYLRIRSVAGLKEWEFKLLNDNERINYIEKKGKKLNPEDIYILLKYSENKDDIVTKIIKVKGKKLNIKDIRSLTNKRILNGDLNILNNNILKIIESKGEKLNDHEIYLLIFYSPNKELIKKTLLQNGVDYKLINHNLKVYNKIYNLNIPLIPDNHNRMLNEIKRIKEIMI